MISTVAEDGIICVLSGLRAKRDYNITARRDHTTIKCSLGAIGACYYYLRALANSSISNSYTLSEKIFQAHDEDF